MDYENLIVGLKAVRNKYRAKKLATFETDIAEMIDDILRFMEEQEKYAEIGKAVIYAFDRGLTLIEHNQNPYEYLVNIQNTAENEKDLLDWYKKEVE